MNRIMLPGHVLKPPPREPRPHVLPGSLPTSEEWRKQRAEAVTEMQHFVGRMVSELPFKVSLSSMKTPWGGVACVPSPQGWMFSIGVERGDAIHNELCQLPYLKEAWPATFEHWRNMIRWWSDPDGEFET